MAEDPIQTEYRKRANDIAAMLDGILNPGLHGEARTTGFALLIFKTGEADRVNYISNADRADMLASMKHFIKRAEGQPNTSGSA